MMIDSLAASLQSLGLAESRLAELRAAIDEYFARRPYSACIGPHETLPDYTAYRARLVDPIPRNLQNQGREIARTLRGALEQLSLEQFSLDQLREIGVPENRGELVDALERLCRMPRRRFFIPQVKARTELAMAEHVHAHPASLHAPEWNPVRREVTILVKDPEVLFKGKIAVEFYLAAGALPELYDSCAVAVLRAHHQEIEKIASAIVRGMSGEDQQTVPAQRQKL